MTDKFETPDVPEMDPKHEGMPRVYETTNETGTVFEHHVNDDVAAEKFTADATGVLCLHEFGVRIIDDPFSGPIFTVRMSGHGADDSDMMDDEAGRFPVVLDVVLHSADEAEAMAGSLVEAAKAYREKEANRPSGLAGLLGALFGSMFEGIETDDPDAEESDGESGVLVIGMPVNENPAN